MGRARDPTRRFDSASMQAVAEEATFGGGQADDDDMEAEGAHPVEAS